MSDLNTQKSLSTLNTTKLYGPKFTKKTALHILITLIFTGFLLGGASLRGVDLAQAEPVSSSNLPQQAYLIVPDIMLGNVQGTEEVFSSLISELEKQNIPKDNIETFRYDPYQGITQITQDLNSTLQGLATKTGDSKISVLGYGIGGLLVRNYLESNVFTDNIERVVFVATPHTGTIAYTELLYGKNLSYANAWEQQYWIGKEVPTLLKQVLPTQLPLSGVEITDNALTPIREAVQYSIIDDLINKEADPQSPIKTLPILNLRSSGYNDGAYFTPRRIRTAYYTPSTAIRQSTLQDNIVIEAEKGIGDGYVSIITGTLPHGQTRDYWAKHEEMVHQSVKEIIGGFNLPTANVSQYHNGQYSYQYNQGPYPKWYYGVSFKANTSADIELLEIDTSTIQNAQKIQEDDRVLLFKSGAGGGTHFTGQIKAKIASHARQTISLSTTISATLQDMHTKTDNLTGQIGENIQASFELNPYCVSQNWQRICTLLSSNVYPYNSWQITSREIIQYPIILIHGIMGSFNSDMLHYTTEDDPLDVSGTNFRIDGLKPTNDLISARKGERWFNLPTDESWTQLTATMELAGLQKNIDYFQFSYDWRHPNQISAYNLRDYIREVQNLTKAPKVSIMAHSMGGLVARAYIEDMANPSVRYSGNTTSENISLRVPYEQNIARLVMAGTPQKGSGTAIPRWYGGDTLTGGVFPEGVINHMFMQTYLGFVDKDYLASNQKDNPQGYVFLQQQVPSTRDLLPTYETSLKKHSFAPTLTNPFNFVETWMHKMSDNTFLQTLNAKSNSQQSNLASIDTLSLAGTGEPTISTVHLMEENYFVPPLNSFINFWSNWYIKEDGTKYWFHLVEKNREGDESVLTLSALGIDKIPGEEIRLDSDFDHGTLFQQKEFIARTMQKLIPNYQGKIVEGILEEMKNALTVNIYSPADIEIVMPDGTTVSQSMDEEKMMQKGIISLSQGPKGHKMLYIPDVTEGEYTIHVKGNGEGAYTLQTAYTDDTSKIVYDRLEGTTHQTKHEQYTFRLEKNEDGQIADFRMQLQQPPSVTPPILEEDNTPDAPESTPEDTPESTPEDSTEEQPDIPNTPIEEISQQEGPQRSRIEIGEIQDDTPFGTMPNLNQSFQTPVTEDPKEYQEKNISLNTNPSVTLSNTTNTTDTTAKTILQLLISLEESTPYMKAKKTLWIRLIRLMSLPEVEKNDRLQTLILQILEKDIQKSLRLDTVLQSTWKWWNRKDIITTHNENILRDIQSKFIKAKI